MSIVDHVDYSLFTGGRVGIEREALRITPAGHIASTPHPRALGHKLTHPSITVDFSEGLIEVVTSAHHSTQDTLAELGRLHSHTCQNLESGELLWPLSMPPSTSPDRIQIADFGPSLSGRMKQIYRQGLANRYGKIMQTIAGVHFNISLAPAFIDQFRDACRETATADEPFRNAFYFRLIRAFDRHAWLLPWLFGASPIAATSSVWNDVDWLEEFDGEHVYSPHCTSLRLSDIGYQSPAQANLKVSHRDVKTYARELVKATQQPWPEYVSLGVHENGDWQQLNGNVLQIENEYYSAIRPKQITERGERPACALIKRGVAYTEIRLLDVDPFQPTGIGLDTANFMPVFLLNCLQQHNDAEDITDEGRSNLKRTVTQGRDPKLQLQNSGQKIALKDWAADFLGQCSEIAAKLDQAQRCTLYSEAVNTQLAKLNDPAQLPSQQVEDHARSVGYAEFCQSLMLQHATANQSKRLIAQEELEFQKLADDSFTDARELEQQGGDLAQYIRSYFDSWC